MVHQSQFSTLLILSILLFQLHDSQSWWFSSDKQAGSKTGQAEDLLLYPKLVGAEFALDTLEGNDNAIGLVNTAKLQMQSSESCWVNAYTSLFSGCSKIMADEDLKDKLAWALSDCFQRHSGRPGFPKCDSKYPTKNCLKDLNDDAHRVFLQYFLQIDSICHQLQIHAFKYQTERLVNDLKKSAEYAEEKLVNIDERGKILIQSSKDIHGSLSSIDLKTQQVAQTSEAVRDNVYILKDHAEKVYEQSKGIADSQVKLIEGQDRMKERLDEGMEMLHESYSNLGLEIDSLKNETVEIEKEIGKVGEEMFSKMSTLQGKADDIESMTVSALDKQRELLEGQLAAVDGLQLLTQFQSKALEESRGTLQQLAEFGKKQQDELLMRQEQLQEAHNRLAENSKSILAAQEAFESKQARMLTALEKLFALHNSMLLESRSIKIFIIYSLLIFVLYMFTSMKQTYNIRSRLYIGLIIALMAELVILWWTTCSLEYQEWLAKSVRWTFMLLALGQFLYAIFTYRDYEVLNHKILLTLINKVNGLERQKMLEQWEMDDDSDVNWALWVDEDLPEDVGLLEDPDFVLVEEVGENVLELDPIPRGYQLRNRNRHN